MGQRRDNPRTKKIPARSWLQQLPIHSDFIEEYRLLVEKEVATHSSMLAWIMPWTKEPGGYSTWDLIELDTTQAA